MERAADEFPDAYGYKKKALGENSGFYMRTQFNTHNWIQINSTAELHTLLWTEMNNSNRINNSQLDVHLSFGKAKRGENILEDDHDYFDSDRALDFSQHKTNGLDLGSSPAAKLYSKDTRENTWSSPGGVQNLLLRMYCDPTSILYNGFLKEQGEDFYRLLKMEIDSPEHFCEETSPLRNAATGAGGILSDDAVRQYILNPYNAKWQTHSNNCKGFLPKKNKYPPIDQEASIALPPTVIEWRTLHEESATSNRILTEYKQRRHVSPMPSLMASAVSTQPAGGINAITFTLHGTRNTVMIKGGLTEESTMRLIMGNGAAFYDSIDTYNYEVGLANGLPYSFSNTAFEDEKLGTFMDLRGVKLPLEVELIPVQN